MEQHSEVKSNSLAGLVATFSSLVLATVGGLSIAHEWAYFNVIGRRWITLLEFADFVTLGLEWLPVGIGIIAPSWVLGRSIGTLFKKKPSTSSVISRDEFLLDDHFRSLRRLTLITATPFVLLFATVWLFQPVDLFAIEYALFAVLYVVGFVFFVTQPSTFELILKRPNLLLLILPPFFLFLTAVHGAINAYDDLRKPELQVDIEMIDQDAPRQVGLLRNLQRGVLIRGDSSVEFHRWEMVKSITSKKLMNNTKHHLCSFTGYVCDVDNKNPP